VNAPSSFGEPSERQTGERQTGELHSAERHAPEPQRAEGSLGQRTTPEVPGRASASKRQSALRQARAALAEQAVARLLAERGFQIVATNLRLGHLEIDIVARRSDLVVVVEVRARDVASWTTGFGSITAGKRRRVREAARRLWRRRYRKDLSVSRLRLDAAAVLFGPGGMKIHYAEGAF
jgi:putative endonuclease